ncbi:hypothetical protein [Halomonas binhaiensis]|uniref:Uncharacterized protein n=1 Tax=Halomonas binhaiensis TaxID=2562282 RepID=A0A5C1NLC8_9GAMM|nr:hypothetical protein [Halomonas binhaiensis]QEM83610.1 hypothetical protein E4T21_20110 [Halomonas binhaiensis]
MEKCFSSKRIEYHSEFISSQTRAPLIQENHSGDVSGNLLSLGKRIFDDMWEYIPGSLWPRNVSIIEGFQCIIKNIIEYSQTTDGIWLSKIIKNLYIHKDSLRIKTRFPISDLNRVLTCPRLNMEHIKNERVGDFILNKSLKNEFLIPQSDNLPKIELVPTSNRFVGKRLFEEGKLDIGWGIGVPSSFFDVSDSGPFSSEAYLPMHYFVHAGSQVSEEKWLWVKESLIDLYMDIPGVISTRSRYMDLDFTDNNHLIDRIKLRKTCKESKPLYYSDFDPNREVAYRIAKHTGV